MTNRKLFLAFFLIGLIGAIIGSLITLSLAPAYFSHHLSQKGQSATQEHRTIIYKGGEKSSIITAAKNVEGAVVNIDTISRNSGIFGGDFDKLFVPFFGGELPQKKGTGSGVIIDADGVILTNEHVIKDATEINVTLADKRHFKGTVIGRDPASDIAIVKVAEKGLPAATLGNSDELSIGEWVIAIGNPYGFTHTVTVGVISAKGRPIQEEDKVFDDLLQTDAAINPGNSGGPLVNLNGEVIGINTAIVPFAQGIGFAIPINTAKNVVAQLRQYGKVKRPFIGVKMQTITPEIAKYLNLPIKTGVIVIEIMPGTPADRIGLRKGDVIKSFNGSNIETPNDLTKQVRHGKIGDKFTIKIIRDGKEQELSGTLAEMQ